ncbi:MAG: YfcE family phosphodiesterase [Clostridiales bacterium]|nr:YfcE family phosphodiesterase [Clostridiales bacterium]
MRAVAFADTHQKTALFHRCVEQAMEDGAIDVLIHCGDGVRDLEAVESELLQRNPNIRIYAVRGNCDIGAFRYPGIETTDLNGVRTLITHGYDYQVKHGLGKLSRAAHAMGMRLVFFGHTHQPLVREKHGVTLINPGSLASWSLTDTAYLEVIIDETQHIRANFIKLQAKTIDN